MPYTVEISYDDEFVALIEGLVKSRPRLAEIEGIGSQLDLHKTSAAFFNADAAPTADTSVDANANVAGRDVITYNYEVPKPLMKLNSLYNLWKEMKRQHGVQRANDVIGAEFFGTIYINDAWDIGRPYCFNYSAYDIALEGLQMSNRLDVHPAKSLSSFLRQIEQFIVYAANSTLGATGIADLLIVAAWYIDRIKKTGSDHHLKVYDPDGIDTSNLDTYVYEAFTSLIYTLNWEFRGNQSPFTNLSLYDRGFLTELVPTYLIKGVAPSIHTVEYAQELFLKAYNDTLRRTPITFPVLTACFAVEADKTIRDRLFLARIAASNREFGAINIYCGETSTLSSCCRLRSNVNDIGYSNTFGAGSTKVGSLGVVTVNLPRLAEIAKKSDAPMEAFLEGLDKLVVVAGEINHAKRMFIKKRIERGSLPLYTLGLMDLSKQFSTCGITGLYEACQIMGHEITSDEGQSFVRATLDLINETNKSLATALGYPHNMEQVPGESSTVKLADKDRAMGFECGAKYPYYSNQFIPLTSPADMLDRIILQGEFDQHCTGGAICHFNLDAPLTKQDFMDLADHCAKAGVVYWAANHALGHCPNGHGMHVVSGTERLGPECPECGAVMETYTRVVGFLTNTKHWNKARRKEDWPKRVFY